MEEVERLVAVLGEEVRICDVLASVLRDEQEAVVRLRPEAMLTCLEQRQVLQEQLTRLAAERRAVVRAVGTVRGKSTERATEVLPLLPDEPQARVREQVRRLRGALLTARSLERQNAFLIGSELDTVGELLRTLRALTPEARYDANAELAAVRGGPERLDQRA